MFFCLNEYAIDEEYFCEYENPKKEVMRSEWMNFEVAIVITSLKVLTFIYCG